MIFAAYQIITSVSWTLSVKWPEPFASVSELIYTIAQFSITRLVPLQCFDDVITMNHYSHLVTITVIPLGIMLYFLARAARSEARGRGRAWNIGAALTVSFYVLPTTSMSLFEHFNCKEFEELGSRLLVTDLRQDCNSTKYKLLTTYACLMLAAFPLAQPLMYLLLTFRERDKIDPRGCDSEMSAILLRDQDETLAYLRPLFRPYAPRLFCFEVVDVYRRILMCDRYMNGSTRVI